MQIKRYNKMLKVAKRVSRVGTWPTVFFFSRNIHHLWTSIFLMSQVPLPIDTVNIMSDLYLCKWEGEIKCVGGETGRDVTLVGHSCPACMSHRLLLNHRHHSSHRHHRVRVGLHCPSFLVSLDISAELFLKQSIGQKYSRSSWSAANNKRCII